MGAKAAYTNPLRYPLQRLASSLARLVAYKPWLVILLFSALTAFWAAQMPSLAIDPDIRKMMPADHPDIVFEDWTNDFFGINAAGVVLVSSDAPQGVFTPATLAVVKHISDEMETLELVDGADVASLAALDNIISSEDSLEVEPFFEEAPATQTEADAIREAVLANPMMVGTIVSRDASATLIGADILPGSDKVALYEELQRIVASAPPSDARIVVAGRPVIEGEMGRIARADMMRMLPYVLLTISVLLALLLRSKRGVVLPILVVLTSTVWTLGIQAFTGAPFLAINSSIPTLLVAIGVADGIHIVHHFASAAAAHPDWKAPRVVVHTMEEMTAPVIMTSVTTAAGFLSMVTSELVSMRLLGAYLAIGVMAAMLFSLTLLPATLALLPLPRRRSASESSADPAIITSFMQRLASLVSERPRAVLLVAAGVSLVASIAIPRISINASLVNNFPLDNPVRIADKLVRERFVGALPMEITMDGGSLDAWKDPEKLRAMVAFQDALEESGRLGETRSIADFVRRMNQVMNPGDPDAYRIPDSRELIAQYLLLYSISGEPDDFDDVVDYDYQWANVRGNASSDHSAAIATVLAHIDELAEADLEPLGVQVRPSGTGQTLNMFVNLIINSQIRSIGFGLVLVGIVSAWLTGSLLGGLFCLVPVLMGTLFNFAALGWLDIPLGVTSAVTSSMGIGIGVDYAIHYVVRYRRAHAQSGDGAKAIRTTMQSSGVAILYNALVVLTGFAVLSTSGFLVNQHMGLLVAINMAVCSVGALTVLAAVLYLKPLRPANL